MEWNNARDPLLTIVLLSMILFLVLCANRAAQMFNPAFPSCHIHLTLEPCYLLGVTIKIASSLLVSGIEYLLFVWFRGIIYTLTGHHSHYSPMKVNLTIANELLRQMPNPTDYLLHSHSKSMHRQRSVAAHNIVYWFSIPDTKCDGIKLNTIRHSCDLVFHLQKFTQL